MCYKRKICARCGILLYELFFSEAIDVPQTIWAIANTLGCILVEGNREITLDLAWKFLFSWFYFILLKDAM